MENRRGIIDALSCWAITLWLYEMFGINTEAILGEEE